MSERYSDSRVATATGGAATQALATNRLIRNTYILLAMTLAFSAVTAGAAVLTDAPRLNIFVVLGGFFGLLFLTQYLRNSVWGLASIFALTGFMGYTLGPIINLYLGLPNGGQTVMMAFGGTAAIFLGLSAYALTTRRDFSFMRGFLFAGILVAFVAALAAYFLQMPGLSLAVSVMFMILMSGLILYQTSEMINGGEDNYIMATITLYVAIYNLFTSLLHLLGLANE
ncbi:Bax inhibitor-1/YccA family protein [Halorhodospira sp. 9621]|uniref:Bax inhibitor-1/YccA family protein n=1 Tax=Halorhodospira TaxID=85108 RepID=UPI001EE7D60F|nr:MULTISPECIES: Bax inhibitor-1/YccA family protein [Halorhodospira]MBK5943711.1 BAX inhibitor protein [Halorhodospira halophila]MCG5528340.1 Bax inhibitor-1/YccA family protein [Halorhodospira halophila]MCG5532134.1 Bax inhibitor-1/YccA family protein [Halorhodospira sp. 9621]MCG5537100.1 Bax inhibitor-1/YccA family protein [Halorhodospira sp. 9622]MCG5542552.1 Bax inhibitor-1/YccA family protein [Halorhodospira sp. 9628]